MDEILGSIPPPIQIQNINKNLNEQSDVNKRKWTINIE